MFVIWYCEDPRLAARSGIHDLHPSIATVAEFFRKREPAYHDLGTIPERNDVIGDGH